MEKYSRKSLKNIQIIVQDKTGVNITANRKLTGYRARQMALLTGCLLCFVTLFTFAYAYADENSLQRQRHMKTIEVEQALCDYNKENIVKAYVYVGDSDNEIIAANVFLVVKDEITNADEQELKAIAAEILDIDMQNVYIECVDSEEFLYTTEQTPIQRQSYMKEIEVKQALYDYDKDNIVVVAVHAGVSDDEIIDANIFIVSKDEITDADEQDKIRAIAAEILNLDAENIYIQYDIYEDLYGD